MSLPVGSMLAKELWRSITSSLGRFLAIAGIVALGCGFYAGLSMTGEDMRIASDAFFDGTRLYDIRVLSTMGFDDEQVEAVRAIEGVEEVMPGKAADVMCLLGGEQYAIRMMSMDMEQLRASEADARGVEVESDHANYLNRLVLAKGDWPAGPDECLLSADRVMGDPIEVGEEVEVLYGTSDLEDVLVRRRFRVSGLVHASAFPSNAVLGYTNLGSGIIQQYMFVAPDAFAADIPHTELFVSSADAREELAGSDAYREIVDVLAARIGDAAPELAASRLATIKADAQEEIDEGQAEFDAEAAKARSELAEAKAKLDDALAELEAGMAKLASGQAEYDDGAAQLASARAQANAELAAAREKIAAAENELKAGERQLGMTQADIDAARKKLDEGRAQLAEGEAAWAKQRAQLVEAAGQIDTIGRAADALLALAYAEEPSPEEVAAAVAQIRAGAEAAQALADSGIIDAESGEVAALEALMEEIRAELEAIDYTAPPEEITEQLRRIAQEKAAIISAAIGEMGERVRAGIAQGDDQIAAARAELEKNASQLDQAQDARKKLDAGWTELERGRAELASQEERARSQIAAAQATLDAAAAELAAGRAELAAGRAEYEDGLAQYASGSAEVDARLGDAAAQLEAARAEVSELEPPDIYVLDRTKNVGVASYHDDSKRIDAIARVFPAIFFLVAALVALTTMTRMVEDERTEIGTHKALGFSTAQITGKYMSYAALAGVAGSALGIGILSQVLPLVIEIAYAIMYNIPVQTFPLPIEAGIAARSAGLGVGVTILATGAAAAATLMEVPAALMLPRAPRPGKRILLERVRPIWSRLSFSWKVTLRNLFRYKRRMAMTVIGIAGCTGLLLTGLGLHDSIWDIIDNQYEGPNPLARYNLIVGLDDDGRQTRDRVAQIVEDEGGGRVLALVEGASMQLSSASHDVPQAVSVYVADDPASLVEAIVMRERTSGESIPFDENSVVLTEKMAGRLGVGVGDAVRVFEQDEIGNAKGAGTELVITGITENYVFHYLYMGAGAWEAAMGKEADPDTVLAQIGEGDDVRREVSGSLLDEEGVSTAIFNTETIDSYRRSLRSVNMIVVVLVVAAAALAFIVLYNLTNINIIERTREIASLKVLGFERGEVASYVFREIALLVGIGALCGLGLGTVLEGFVVRTAEVDAVMFGRAIHPPSYGIAFALTFVFSAAVMAFMLPKLRAIDMVESLKSVD